MLFLNCLKTFATLPQNLSEKNLKYSKFISNFTKTYPKFKFHSNFSEIIKKFLWSFLAISPQFFNYSEVTLNFLQNFSKTTSYYFPPKISPKKHQNLPEIFTQIFEISAWTVTILFSWIFSLNFGKVTPKFLWKKSEKTRN